MLRTVIILVFFVLIRCLVLTSVAKADLVGLWRFDEGSGTIANDASGNGHHGTLVGGPTWAGGKIGAALDFDGQDDLVELGAFDVVGPEITLAGWMRPDTFAINDGRVITKANEWGENDHWWMLSTISSGAEIRLRFRLKTEGQNTTTLIASSGPLVTEEWQHAAATWDGSTMRLYLNAEEVGSVDKAGAAVATNPDISVAIGSQPSDAFAPATPDHVNKFFDGLLDDVRLYNNALTAEQLQGIMEGEGYPFAFGPDPADGAFHEDTWVTLSWSPGDFAVSHDVYLGDNFDDVNDGAEGTFQGNQTATFLVAGFPGFPYPDGLVPGTTYYWRIDEVNDTEPNSPWKGNVWSFSVPPKTAYYPDPADCAEQVETDVELSWTGGFGSKLHTVYFGDNFDEVDNATDGLPQGVATYTPPGPLEMAKTYYWRVDEFDGADTYKGDVWSFITEGAVGNPNPANGAVDVGHTPILTWSPGVYGASHQVYFGTDKDAVKNADTNSPEYKGTGDLGSERYEPGKLAWHSTYYWRVDEVNNVHPDSPWIGPVWSFTTADFIVVDDFEAYNDLNPEEEGSNRIFLTWIDGYDTPTNGSQVGYTDLPFCEQTIVHSGRQSMPLFYNNSGPANYSEATLPLSETRDWTEEGVGVLTLWFYGDPANAAESMYVAVTNGIGPTAVVYHDNPDATLIDEWTEWKINLEEFSNQGVVLTNVDRLAIGFGNRNNPQVGDSGMIFIDDIRLYRPLKPAP